MARTKGGTTLGWRTIRRDTKGYFYADQDRYTVVMRRDGGVHVCALRLDIPPPASGGDPGGSIDHTFVVSACADFSLLK